MSQNKEPRFLLYRYQILPISRDFQPDLFEGFSSLEDLLAHKNALFAQALEGISSFNSDRADVTHKILIHDGDFYLYRFAVSRRLDRETRDFKHEPIDTWPSFMVAIWNHPERQLLAIERRFAAFQLPETVVRHLCSLINVRLRPQNLRAHWEPLFEKNVFWNIINRYTGRVQQITFHMVTPNMANISRAIADEVKDLCKSTNTTNASLALASEPDAALDVKSSNPHVESLVEYSSKGGGNIGVRVKGIKRVIQTSKSVKTFEITELEAQDPKVAAEVLKSLMDQ